ncbi:pyruvate kinase [Salmonella enterica]|uniref:pyruvate kinase n=1 Tax=Salmonella enterica TaxID=28901 RepID=UPI001EE07105|nr:pyruvate kinase [Salmonella enterica]EJE9921533.1 pyruvate kinase [Salmonella enterica]EKC8050871.1 pyruvate kinase [Salmonella enterica]MCG3490792.1 pyruvate kinase [Salmonella enterica subsp. diarizonae]
MTNQHNYRRTKIVATLGPATDNDSKLEELLASGVNVVRLNFSHGSAQDHIQRAQKVRLIAEKLQRYISIMADLQGPKIRISSFAEGKVTLTQGQTFTLDVELAPGEGNSNTVGCDYSALPGEVSKDDLLLLDDGRIKLRVTDIQGSQVITTVVLGGRLSNHKGLNKQGGGLSADALTPKDKEDIKTAAGIGVDYLAVSYVKSPADVELARQLMQHAGGNAHIVSKIERAEVVSSDETMQAIIQASDAIMVARGDLGVEIGDPQLVAVQKKLIDKACRLNRAVITATQMMESMIENAMPTRAEVIDVANAVIDRTDAVMLSAETATGNYPAETVRAMSSVCIGAESIPSVQISNHRLDAKFDSTEDAIAMASMYIANHLSGIKAVVAMTESGKTALLMSRISSGIPVYAFSRHSSTLNRVALYRGVTPVLYEHSAKGVAASMEVLRMLKERGLVKPGDRVIVTQGDILDLIGSTNTCRILTV